MIISKIILSIQISFIIIVLFILPGFLLRKLLSGNAEAKPILGLDFSIGYSFLILPALIVYYLRLPWISFSIMFFAIDITIIIIFCLRNNIFDYFKKYINLNFKHNKKDFYFWLYFILLLSITVILFLKGGHFIGDHQHHLAYIQKLVNNDVITPYAPMYKDVEFIPYAYAYNINYLFISFICRITECNINYLWDVSPALFFLFSFSAFKYLLGKIVTENNNKYILLIIFSVTLVIDQSFTFSPILDFELMPIPDQFSRNIFLPLLLSAFFITLNENNRARLSSRIIPFLLIANIMFTHVYSYMVFIITGGFFVLLTIVFQKNGKFKFRVLSLYISVLAFSGILFFFRIINTNFFSQDSAFSSILEKYSFFIQGFLIVFLIGWMFFEKKFEKGFLRINGLLNGKWYYLLFSLLVIAFYYLVNRYSLYFKASITGPGKYAEFINTSRLNNNVFIAASIMIFMIFGFINSKENKHLSFVYKNESIIFFVAIILSIAFMYCDVVNIVFSKIFSQIYVRRFVYLNQHYFEYIYALCIYTIIATFLKNGNKKNLRNIILNIFIFVVIISTGYSLVQKRLITGETYNREYVLRDDNVFSYIREHVEPWSVIASYKLSAMDVVAQTPNYFLASRTVNAPKPDDIKSRYSNEYKIFQFKNIQKIQEIVQKYEIDYILTEHDNTDKYAPDYPLKEFNEKVKQYPDYFIPVYSDEKYILYKINRE